MERGFADELYREVILDHFRSPRHRSKMEKPDRLEFGKNPLCGDEIELYLKFAGDRIADVSFAGQGCSISQSSASMMAEAVLNKSVAEAESLAGEFRAMMVEGKPADSLSEPLEDAKALEGVRRYPVRVKCALLCWNTLLEALKKSKQK